MYEQIKSLSSEDKPKTFKNPLDSDDRKFVRFYTIGEGSCFFHSVFHAIDENYSNLENDEQKMEYIAELREQLSDYYFLSNGYVSSLEIYTRLIKELEKLKKIPITSKSTFKYNDNNFSIEILKCLKKIDLERNYPGFNFSLNSVLADTRDVMDGERINIPKYKEKMYNNLTKIIDCEYDVKPFVINLIETSEKKAFQNFRDDISNVSCYFDNRFLSLVSDYFDVDIFIINSNNRLVNVGYSEVIKGRNSVVLLNIEDVHYEILGIGEKSEKGKVKNIYFLHSPDDKTIRFMRDVLNRRREIPGVKEYLDLYYY
jgi:hypothetical protein